MDYKTNLMTTIVLLPVLSSILIAWNANNSNDTNSKFNDFLWRVEGCVDRHAPLKRLNKKQQK